MRAALILTSALLLTSASPLQASADEKPNLTNTPISTSFNGNGHNSTLDGRIFIANVGEDHETVTTRWRARVFRPEALSYEDDGRPNFAGTFSTGLIEEVRSGENALAFCFEDPDQLYTLEAGEAVYRPWVIDSRMYGGGVDSNRFRRRRMTLKISDPFTAQAEISHWEIGDFEYLTLAGGGHALGIEPTITADGRLFLYQGGPRNNGEIDHLMYTLNSDPCAASGWSEPKPLSAMYEDPDPRLEAYPLSYQPMAAATGEGFGAQQDLIKAAYPWVDPEGRDVFYMAVPNVAVGGRREAVSVIGADTNWRAIHIDGGINAERDTVPKLFYSGPMWRLEADRFDREDDAPYLPVTHIHDVVPLFGSNTGDYNEVDLGELVDPFHMLYLPMNELVTRGGEYDLRRTPDLSPFSQTGTLLPGASLTATNDLTASSSLQAPHGRGRALVMAGEGGLRMQLDPQVTGPLKGFTAEVSLRPDALGLCGAGNSQVVLSKLGVMDITLEADGALNARLRLGRSWAELRTPDPLPKESWSHIALVWDSVEESLTLFLNGLPVGHVNTPPGPFRLGPGYVTVGTSNRSSQETCGPRAPFQGAIDEVILFSHARSARSICMHAPGAACMDDAIQVDPSPGQLLLSQAHPDCTNPGDLGSLPCAQALHRSCAQAGASAALDSATNAWDTAMQLISSRPPTAMAGVATSLEPEGLAVACAPIQHDSKAITFRELQGFHGGCHPLDPLSSACTAAAHRFCLSLGWTTAMTFEVTARPWISCFDADLVEMVSRSTLGSACLADVTTGACQLEVSAFCDGRGYGGGVIQELPPGDMAEVHCFRASLEATWEW